MAKKTSEYIPDKLNFSALKKFVQKCQGCDLYKNATQAVFGEGPSKADIVFVGEQPGDVEDKAGHPFVGPSGKIFDRALAEAGIDRNKVYVTNAVKHFKWERQGQRRLHGKPNIIEIRACKPWLEAELQLIKPKIIVCLGATAGYSIFAHTIKIGEMRSHFHHSPYSENTFVTTHPSSLLRQIGKSDRQQAYAFFVQDLKKVAQKLKTLAP